MHVLTINDADGHMHVFDVSTKEKVQEIFGKLVDELQKMGRIYSDEIDGVKKAVLEGDLDGIQEAFSDLHDCPGFERSGGGQMYVVKVADKWEAGLGKNIWP